MERNYRINYQGEFIVHNTNKTNGVVEQQREWVPNTIVDRQLSGYALVLGQGLSRVGLNLQLFTHHRGGLGGSMKLAFYGCNALHREIAPHFLIVNSRDIAKEVVESGYADNHIVITHTRNIRRYPDNKFHLIPMDPGFTAGATALYLAAFDGNNKIYFVGFDGQDTPGYNNNIYAGTPGYPSQTSEVDQERWYREALEVFNTYNNVEFIKVNTGSIYMPESWKSAPNVSTVDWRQFVYDMDIGST